MPDFFKTIQDRRAEAIAKLDAETFAPLIRNHLVQLYRKAHAKDAGLLGVLVGMGRAFPRGDYLCKGDNEPNAHPDDKARLLDASDWLPGQYDSLQPKHAETLAFFVAVHEYADQLCHTLPYIDDITPADLETTRAKKSAIHGPRGLRVRLAKS